MYTNLHPLHFMYGWLEPVIEDVTAEETLPVIQEPVPLQQVAEEQVVYPQESDQQQVEDIPKEANFDLGDTPEEGRHLSIHPANGPNVFQKFRCIKSRSWIDKPLAWYLHIHVLETLIYQENGSIAGLGCLIGSHKWMESLVVGIMSFSK